MILIRPYYEIESYIYEDEILKHIEKAARTCYKSEHQIGDFEKTKKFVAGVIKRGHETVIEHYSVSVRFIIDRGISHELVRHRLAVYSQESTRYASYNKDQFSNQITYIIPPWIDLKEGEYTIGNNITWKNPDGILIDIEVNDDIRDWLYSIGESEIYYMKLLNNYSWKPEQARSVLPNSLKTEILMTANLREWRHVFKLRALGITGNPHPQMKEIMVPLLKEFKKRVPVIFDDLIIPKDNGRIYYNND